MFLQVQGHPLRLSKLLKVRECTEFESRRAHHPPTELV
jgi:hypothetical protein